MIAVAILLGLRHATDPDHLAAVTTLLASTDRRARDAARLGLAWGAGHALTLFALGVPIVLYRAYLPETVQRAAETAIGFLIAALAVWLLVRWRRGAFHAHAHGPTETVRTRACTRGRPSPMRTPASGRRSAPSPSGSCTGSAAAQASASCSSARSTGRGSRSVRSGFSPRSQRSLLTLLTTGFGPTLAGRSISRFAPGLGVASLVFGLWYALGAQNLLPYYFEPRIE